MNLFQYDDTSLWVTPFSKVIFRACELSWLPWRSGYRPFWESPCPDQLVSLNLLLSLIVGRDHQVVIWIHVLKGWRLALDGGRFAIHTGDLQHPAGVVFQQIPRERFPSSSHADHDVFVVQHLQWKESKRVKFRAFLQYLESAFSSKCCYCVWSVWFFTPGCLSARGVIATDLANRLWKRLRLCHASGSGSTSQKPGSPGFVNGSESNPWIGLMCQEAFLWHLIFHYRPSLTLPPPFLLLPQISASILPTRVSALEPGLRRLRKCLLLNITLIITQIFDAK